MKAWKNIESKYLQHIFSGEDEQVNELYRMIRGGALNAAVNGLHLDNIKTEIEKILYSQMIPFGWSVSPTAARPFIWLVFFFLVLLQRATPDRILFNHEGG